MQVRTNPCRRIFFDVAGKNFQYRLHPGTLRRGSVGQHQDTENHHWENQQASLLELHDLPLLIKIVSVGRLERKRHRRRESGVRPYGECRHVRVC